MVNLLAMLSFDLRELQEHAVAVDGVLEPDDSVWATEDVRPTGPIHVTGRLSAAGSDRYYFAGHLESTVETTCRRCLEPVTVHVNDELNALFVDADDEETSSDPDVFLIDPNGRDLDLRPAVREHWLLAAPAYAVCREDCRGLCPTCGTDLNKGQCECTPAVDSRWDALRTAKPSATRSVPSDES